MARISPTSASGATGYVRLKLFRFALRGHEAPSRKAVMTCLALARCRLLLNCILPAAVALFFARAVRAEDLTQTYTRATPPPREALERLSLKMGWSLYLPVEGLRDGLFSVQP